MISEQYINEAKRIRRIYLQNIREIVKQEPKVIERRNVARKIQEEMEITVHSDVNDLRKSLELNSRLLVLEKEINAIQDIIRPFYDNIEKLKNDTDRLYLSIKEKYPDLDIDTIQEEIISNLDE
jgi:vacuolar-type H+-ATPase subunit E/Vma4